MNAMQKIHIEVISQTPKIGEVEQVGAKSLYVAKTDSGDLILYSYTTPVAVHVGARWVVTSEKFSRTTSKQITEYCGNYKLVPAKEFEAMLNVILG